MKYEEEEEERVMNSGHVKVLLHLAQGGSGKENNHKRR
jgi:hypothetical protein